MDTIARNSAYSRAYLLVICPVILALSVLIGPFGALDETEHFLRAASIAKGQIIPLVLPPTSTRQRGVAGGYVDRQVAAVAREEDYKQRYRAGVDPSFKFNRHIIKLTMRRVASGQMVFSEHNNTALYPPILYIGSATGVYLGEISDVPVLTWLYIGRIINALLSGTAAFFAIRMMPAKPAFMLLAASSPLILFQSATVSADAMLFASFLLFTALMYRLATLNRQTHGEVLLTGLVVCAISVGKVAYAPLAALPLPFTLIRDRRLSS